MTSIFCIFKYLVRCDNCYNQVQFAHMQCVYLYKVFLLHYYENFLKMNIYLDYLYFFILTIYIHILNLHLIIDLFSYCSHGTDMR